MGDGKEKEKVASKDAKKKGCEDAEAIVKNEVKLGKGAASDGIHSEFHFSGEIASASINEVMPKNGAREKDLEISTPKYVKRGEYRGGFQRNADNRDESYKSQKYRVKLHRLKENVSNLAKKMESGVLNIHMEGNEKKLSERMANGDKLKLNTDEMLGSKSNEVDLKIEKTAGDKILGVGGEKYVVLGRDIKGSLGKSSHSTNEIQQHRVEGETSNDRKKALKYRVKDDVLVDESGNGVGSGGVGNGFRRYLNRR